MLGTNNIISDLFIYISFCLWIVFFLVDDDTKYQKIPLLYRAIQ